MKPFSHVDGADRPTMVDVGDKQVSARTAVAATRVQLPAAAAAQLRAAGYATAKGPVFHTAIVAGTMAAKRTHELIPFCHPLGLEKCQVDIEAEGDEIFIRCTVGVHHRTGVEMEALTGASVAALTIYDMCKALSHDIVIGETRLLAKTGGKADFLHAAPLAGLVLAGGHSRRMQTDKATLRYEGENQLERTVRLLGQFVPEVYVSVRADQADEESRRGYRQIIDREPDGGPAAGISAALASRPVRAWLVLAVDLPFLSAATLAALIQARDPARLATAYSSAHDGLPEPLCAIWEPAAASALARALTAGERCPRKFLISHAAGVATLPATEALANVNTPEEYAAASAALAGRAIS